jgi:predicted lipoprotein with Yx(FWY)xxD motif
MKHWNHRTTQGSRRGALSTAGLALSLAAVAALTAACGGSGGSDSGSSSAGSSATAGTPAGSGSGTAGGSAGGSGVSLKTASGPLGTFLTDGSGRTLYDFGSDTSTTSSCSGACAEAWPPLTVTGTPKVASGIDAGKVTTFKRSDGTTQLAYNGHPLYTFAQDAQAGDTNGQGSDGFGAPWYVVAPSGASITKAAPAADSATGSGSGSGSGGGW